MRSLRARAPPSFFVAQATSQHVIVGTVMIHPSRTVFDSIQHQESIIY